MKGFYLTSAGIQVCDLHCLITFSTVRIRLIFIFLSNMQLRLFFTFALTVAVVPVLSAPVLSRCVYRL
jgi:hypothetical protein